MLRPLSENSHHKILDPVIEDREFLRDLLSVTAELSENPDTVNEEVGEDSRNSEHENDFDDVELGVVLHDFSSFLNK